LSLECKVGKIGLASPATNFTHHVSQLIGLATFIRTCHHDQCGPGETTVLLVRFI
jgi:hypothetical protein